MRYSDPSGDFYDACNRTELYQLCSRAGIMLSPATPREKMVSYLLGEDEPPPAEHAIHVWRNGLIGLVQDYWAGIEAQLRCPAKELGPPAGMGDPPKPDPSNPQAPLACYRCIDTRVISCLVENSSHEALIQLHRKMPVPTRNTNMGSTMATLTIATAPRTMDGMNAGDGVNRAMCQRLQTQLVNEGALPGDEIAKIAFIDADTPVRRKIVLEGLLQYDRMKGGSPAAQAAPAPSPVVSSQPAPTVDAEPPRTPQTRGKRNGAASTEPAADTRMNNDPNIGAEIVSALTGVQSALNSAMGQLEQVTALQQTVAGNADRQQKEILTAITKLEQSIKLSAAITLWQIENSSDMAPSEVLAAASDYVRIFEKALNAPGKAG